MTSNLLKATLLLTTTLTASAAFAQSNPYQLTFLHAPSQYYSPYISGISNSGQVVGASRENQPGFPTFQGNLWTDGQAAGLSSGQYNVHSASAINGSGQIAVTFTDTSRPYFRHAGILQGGNVTDLGALNGDQHASQANAINDLGQVTGTSTASDYPQGYASHAFLWSNNHLTDLGTLGTGNVSQGYGVNNAGYVVGDSNLTSDSYQYHATLWKNGNIIDLGATTGIASSARGINNAEQIVGYASTGSDASIHYATLWQNGTAFRLAGSFANGSEALAINNRGQIVGSAGAPYSRATDTAVLWQNGNVIDLNTYLDPAAAQAGWHLYSATAISDNGKIAGQGYNARTGEQLGFVLSPVPEPETWASLVSGLAALGWFGARRKRANQQTN
jgi:probable HAF family extracellular repeat protein